jgi:hypothetical protein
MKKNAILAAICGGLLFGVICELQLALSANNQKIEAGQQALFAKIEKLTAAKGQFTEKESVFKVGFLRNDLVVYSGGVKITPPMGLGVWAAFKIMPDHTMVMGDLVLLQEQVNPVMSVAMENGLEVTALHNHFMWELPRIMFMHISGDGKTEELASAVGKVFAKIRETSGKKGQAVPAEIDPNNSTLEPKKIEDILGVKGQTIDGVYKITIGRTTTMSGHEMGNAMGVNTWAAFAGSNEKAVVDGDIAMLESEVQPVLKALRAAGINVVAIHNHMIGESPRIIFLHYWAIGPVADIAKGLKTALDTQSYQKTTKQ